MKTFLPLFLFGCLTSASAATYFVDASRSDDTGDGASWAAAKQTIQAAVDLTADGDTVLVTNGVYDVGSRVTPGGTLSNRVVITNAILVRSVNGPSGTTIRGSGTSWYGQSRAMRCVLMTNGVLEGFTLCGGTALTSGGAINMYGGGVYGAGAAVVRNSILTGNALQMGGGAAYGRLENCLITGNTAYDSGGGAYYSALVNCTVSGNTTGRGGVFGGTATNCVVWGNFSSDGYIANHEAVSFYRSCTCPLPPGTGNADANPLFADEEGGDFRLTDVSPCLDAGDSEAACGSEDILGNARIQGGTVDLGAYEGSVTLALSAPAYVTASDGTHADKIRVEWAAVAGATFYRVYRSVFEDGARTAIGGWLTERALDDTNALSDRIYWYWVRAAAETNGQEQSLLSLPDSGRRGFSPTWFVNAAQPDDSGDGRSWDTAKRTIQAAVDAAVFGDAILVTDGVYNVGATLPSGSTLSNRVSITNGVTVRSVNGAAATVIEGSGTNAYGTAAAVRCVRLINGVLEGFTLRGGATRSSGTASDYQGGGTYVNSAVLGNELRDCVLSGNRAYNGGGAYDGTWKGCVFADNTAVNVGGGVWHGKVMDCVFTNNRAMAGGGSYLGIRTRCQFIGNVATNSGGGAHVGLMYDCVFIGNVASNSGGGAYGATMSGCTLALNRAITGGAMVSGELIDCVVISNTATGQGGAMRYGMLTACTLIGNVSGGSGGGTYSSTLANCAVIGNSSSVNGGGAAGGTLVNCTLVGNTAANNGGGASGATLRNSIVYANTAGVASNNYSLSSLISCCSLPLASGAGNLSADPQLSADQTHLAASSPCIGAGDPTFCSGTDIDGQLWLSPPSMGCDQFYPTLALTVVSAFGGAVPAGLSSNLYGTVIDARVTNSPISGVSTQAVCVGASVVGNAYDQVSPTQVSLTLTNHATLTWNWQASYLLGTGATGSGTVSGAGWYEAGSNATLTATPADGSVFASWGGDTNGCLIDGTTLIAPMTQARSVTANFIFNVQAATPTFTPASGTVFSNTLSVTISCATAGAEIRYTTDGSNPGASSPLYNEPLTLQWDTTVKAQAFKADRLPSATATATYDARFILYVSAARPDDSGAGTNWVTAKKTIQAAVNLTAAGDTVLVTNGTYNTGMTVTPGGTLNNRVVITNAITVRSVNGATVTDIWGSGTNFYGTSSAIRGVYMTAGTLDGFCLRSGTTRSSGAAADCSGGGAFIFGAGGTLCNCTLLENSASEGGGSYGGSSSNCTFLKNAATYGGGTYGGSLLNCALSRNSATYGGGSYEGSLVNCTLTRNTAASYGGGTTYGALTNCIAYFNTSALSNNCFRSTLAFSCSWPLPAGEGNMANDPLFTDDIHLSCTSPCIGAGSYAYCSGTDIDGQPWLNPPCMGCDQVSRFTLSILSDYGGANPAGVITNYSGALIDAWITNSPLQIGATQLVCSGASVTGNAYAQISSTHVSLTLTNNATLTWNWAQSYQPFTYTTTASNAVTITGYLGPAGWVTIPSCIGEKAVTSIGTNAFAGCTGLTGVTIPSSVTNIGAYAFAGCFGLTDVVIPSSVAGIGFAAFVDCISLQSITVQSGNPNYCSAGGVLFNKAQTTLIQCPGGKSGSYAVPASVTVIGNSAFQNCGGLTSVTLPSGITTIGVSAFLYCTSLTSLKFGKQVAIIRNSALAGCAQLTALYFLGNAPNLGLNVFTGVSMGIVYYVPGTSGWSTSYGGLPTATWDTVISNILVQDNSLCFDIVGPDNQSVIVKATTNLIGGTWLSLSTHTLTNGVSHFCDTQWAEHPKRFYRVSVVPEPDTLVLFLIGAAAVGLRRKRRPPSKAP